MSNCKRGADLQVAVLQRVRFGTGHAYLFARCIPLCKRLHTTRAGARIYDEGGESDLKTRWLYVISPSPISLQFLAHGGRLVLSKI